MLTWLQSGSMTWFAYGNIEIDWSLSIIQSTIKKLEITEKNMDDANLRLTFALKKDTKKG